MPDSQRSRKQWRKARHAETCVCVPTHSSTAIHLTTAAEIPTQSTHLPQKNRNEISPLRTGPVRKRKQRLNVSPSQLLSGESKQELVKNPRVLKIAVCSVGEGQRCGPPASVIKTAGPASAAWPCQP